jgi:glycosyltransferase involved in cell wall biosynthesis
LLRTLQRLGLVFYQSRELREAAAGLLGTPVERLENDRHVVLSRGVEGPPALLRKDEARSRLRREWGMEDADIVVLYLGRIVSAKGVFQFMDAVASAAQRNPRLRGVMVGSLPGMDETAAVERVLRGDARLRALVRMLPACGRDAVWEYLSAADIFGFPSNHTEGMPNSLLEAMSMGVPSIAYAIAPVRELEAGTGALVLVPPLASDRFEEEILRLASDAGERSRIGEIGRAQVLERFGVGRNMATAFARLSEMVARRLAEGIGVHP